MNNECKKEKKPDIIDILRQFSETDDINTITNKGLKNMFTFYKKETTNITFRLKNHQEYFISGKVTDVIVGDSNKNLFLVEIELENKEKAIFGSWYIDIETIIPSSYNPIRYFNRIPISEEVKSEIFNRDNNECILKLDGCTNIAEEIDHIIPVSKGGLNNKENLQASCSNCNRKKYNNLLF